MQVSCTSLPPLRLRKTTAVTTAPSLLLKCPIPFPPRHQCAHYQLRHRQALLLLCAGTGPVRFRKRHRTWFSQSVLPHDVLQRPKTATRGSAACGESVREHAPHQLCHKGVRYLAMIQKLHWLSCTVWNIICPRALPSLPLVSSSALQHVYTPWDCASGWRSQQARANNQSTSSKHCDVRLGLSMMVRCLDLVLWQESPSPPPTTLAHNIDWCHSDERQAGIFCYNLRGFQHRMLRCKLNIVPSVSAAKRWKYII